MEVLCLDELMTALVPDGSAGLRVLYTFAGPARKCSLANSLATHCRSAGPSLSMVEVDLLRSDAHDLARRRTHESVFKAVRAGVFNVIISTPPCSSFSRVRQANSLGPPAVRSAAYPQGFPWLRGRQWEEARLGNVLLQFTFELFSLAEGRAVRFMEFPEDLGRDTQGIPASPWQDDRWRKLG